MTRIRLHHCHQTRSMRTLWLLNEMGLEFELAVYPFDKTLRSETYRALSPAGRVPALEIDGEVIWETAAITEILCERFPQTGMGRAPGDPDRTDWLIYLHFAETLSQHTAALTQQHVAIYEDWMRSPTVMMLEAKRLEKCYDVLEARLGSTPNGRDFILSSGFSAVDVSLGQAVYMGRHFVRTEPFPRLDDWYRRLSRRRGFRASVPPQDARLYARDFYEPWPVVRPETSND